MMHVEIQGFDKCIAAMKDLEPKLGNKVINHALISGANFLKKKEQINIRSMVKSKSNSLATKHRRKRRKNTPGMKSNFSSELAVNLISRTERARKKGLYFRFIRPKTMKEGAPAYWAGTSKRTGKSFYIPAAVEYGHGRTKQSCAIPWARQAWDGNKHYISQIIMHEIRIGIDRVGNHP